MPFHATSDTTQISEDSMEKEKIKTEELQIISADINTWANFQGKRELLQHLDGNVIPKYQALKAKCYDCMGGYPEGAMDCELFRCPLYHYMPYKGKELTKTQLLRHATPK